MPLSMLANYGVLHFWQLFFRDNNSNTRNTCNHHKTISLVLLLQFLTDLSLCLLNVSMLPSMRS
jgi:hypothetical protein